MRNLSIPGWKACVVAIAALLAAISPAFPAEPLTGFPFQDEALRYRVSWPSALSLGEARMKARRIDGGRWEFELTLDASVPGITVTDRYRSIATADLCSVEFERETVHGPKNRMRR